MDSVEISLVTCSPHEEVYSLYGHTALRYHDLHRDVKGGDMIFNWGMFSFQAPHFVARFVFGLTDYELGISDVAGFCDYYRRWGSSVIEQVLNLTPQEKLRVQRALQTNYLPMNRTYRYNFFYDNCSTRPRDIIEQCVMGRVDYHPRQDYEPSFREMVREKVRHHRWAMWGNDMLLGAKADLKTNRKEQEFLPENLFYDFDHAVIATPDGNSRPLVLTRHSLVPSGIQMREPDFPLTPLQCALCLLAVSAGIALVEWRRRKTYKYWDATLMLAAGLTGCVLTVMLFSQHPTTSTNLLVLLFNPLHLLFIPSVLRRRKTRYWMLLVVMLCLLAAGALIQSYAEGVAVLALCLLIRIWSNVKLKN